MEEPRLRISEIFLSLQGEGDAVGWPTTFIRLTGCPLRCQYCDTDYAFSGGEWWSLNAILTRVAEYGVRHVCVTGGEPLAQRSVLALLTALCDEAYRVSLETSGALDISLVDARIARVIDIKTPASGECDRNLYANLHHLHAGDQIKFVLCHYDDYLWAKNQLIALNLADRAMVLFSPAYGQLSATDLAEWIIADRLPVRLQIQLHKLLWGQARGR
jgi:7-carboxy-7-deazaguanine synthase